MYWQKRFTREDPDLAIKIEIEEIRKTNPNYGYRRLLPLLKLKGIVINKKKLQRIIKKFKLQLLHILAKAENTTPTKAKKVRLLPIEFTVNLNVYTPIKKSQQIQLNSSIMRWELMEN